MFLKSIRIICVTLTFQIAASSVAKATFQEPDLLILDGARFYSTSMPSLGEILPEVKLPEFIWIHTGNYRGYRASWAVIDKQLFLVGIEGSTQGNRGKRMLSSNELFPDIKFPHKAESFSGSITLDGRQMDYEIAEGDLIETKKINLEFHKGVVVKNSRETENRDALAREYGLSLFEGSGFKESFEDHFILSEIKKSRGKTSGIHFEEDEWSSTLTPKQKIAHPCTVEAIFPITTNDKVFVTLSPLEITSVLQKASKNPFVEQLFKKERATAIRLRISGDRLHWDSRELQETLLKSKHGAIEQKDLLDWAYFIVDTKDRRFITFYLNKVTGELIKLPVFRPATYPPSSGKRKIARSQSRGI